MYNTIPGIFMSKHVTFEFYGMLHTKSVNVTYICTRNLSFIYIYIQSFNHMLFDISLGNDISVTSFSFWSFDLIPSIWPKYTAHFINMLNQKSMHRESCRHWSSFLCEHFLLASLHWGNYNAFQFTNTCHWYLTADDSALKIPEI